MEVPLSLNLQKLSPRIPIRTQESSHWNLVIKRHANLKDDRAILHTYTRMESLGILPDRATMPLVLKACGRLGAIESGKKIHIGVSNTGLMDDIRVQTALVDFYAKCGLLDNAVKVFDGMTERDVVSWNAVISGCVRCFEYEKALDLFARMQKENLKADSVTIVELLLACGELLELRFGKAMHGYCFRNGLFDSNPHVGTALLGFYLRFNPSMGSLVFEMMASRNTISWNAMINGCVDSEDYWKALELFMMMLMDGFECDSITFLSVIQACSEIGSLNLGMQLHQLAVKFGYSSDLYIVNALMNMYSKAGCLRSSCDLFNSIPTRDAALWNSILSSYADNGFIEESVSSFIDMQLKGILINERSIVIMLPLCVNLTDGLTNGKSLHAYAIKIGEERNSHLGNSLLNMYASLNCIEDAMKVFSRIREADTLSWNIFIFTLARNKLRVEACEIFNQMLEMDIKPNPHTVTSMLVAIDDETLLNVGRSFHGYILKHGVEIDASLNTALTGMYMSCGDEETGRNLFENFQDKDVISWNSLISSYTENDQAHKASLTFHQMISKVKPNSVTIVNVLSSYAHLPDLPQGRCLHAYTLRRISLFVFDLSLANAFITMYARCGSLKYAERLFHILPKKNVVSWNAMIAGYGMHGRAEDATLTFSKMLKEGFKPDRITFVSVLSACSHSGMIHEGLQLFNSMVQEFSITPEVVHYACVVDLLARAGHLNEAKEVIDTMPMAPDSSVWRALLGACRVYCDTKLGKFASEKLIELEPTNAGNYVLLSNIYAAAGIWSEVKNLRLLLEKMGLKKPPGKSWIVIGSELHSFAAGDKSHPRSEIVYEKLTSLLVLIKEMGYIPDLKWVLHDEDDERKLARLSSHSEKLAIAFGLISVTGGSPILITKNLRVCGDCHEFSKYVSKLSQREIILRDGSRFHHFVNGLCSCKDYW